MEKDAPSEILKNYFASGDLAQWLDHLPLLQRT